jgi:hypothetical protein
MSKVIVGMTTSIDGFVADEAPDQHCQLISAMCGPDLEG